jgi:hypothetical protein
MNTVPRGAIIRDPICEAVAAAEICGGPPPPSLRE